MARPQGERNVGDCFAAKYTKLGSSPCKGKQHESDLKVLYSHLQHLHVPINPVITSLHLSRFRKTNHYLCFLILHVGVTNGLTQCKVQKWTPYSVMWKLRKFFSVLCGWKQCIQRNYGKLPSDFERGYIR